MDSDDFYARLEPFHLFEQIADLGAYSPVPDDWVVMIGDITGSTRAIAEGRYKSVNMVGAATITAVLNACNGSDVPFVFGGDGGVVVVPGRLAASSTEALRRLQAHAEAVFGLRLRAAAIPVARLRCEGHDLRVRKLLLNRTTTLAMFSGGGLDHADRILKTGADGDADIILPQADAGPPDLEGLSCRWENLAATRGTMMALIVRPAGESDAESVLKTVLAILDQALNGEVAGHAPVNDQTLRFKWPPRGLAIERRAMALSKGAWQAWKWTLSTSLAQKLCHVFGIRLGAYDAPQYVEELKAQTDFRKFDGCFRTVLDCTEEELARLRRMLDAERDAGRLVYGIHADRSALMTCLVFSLEQSRHIHFIDAAGGGFAKAAEALKAQAAGG